MIDAKVSAFLKKNGLNLRNKKVAVAVSGGPDSLALLHFLLSLSKVEHFEVTALHVDHMFRGEESFQDAKFVEQFCMERMIPFVMERINVPAYIEETGMNPQAAARECRYRFFSKVMQERNLQYLALGHHGDDQIETILMRMTRGSSLKAVAGIPFTRTLGNKAIFRPFLCLSRNEIEAYCEENGLCPRFDPSNEKDVYSRNRFRKKIIPFIKEENPLAHKHFQRFSEEMQADESFLMELTVQKMNTVVEKKNGEEVLLHIDRFKTMAIPLQRRGIQLILNYLYKEAAPFLSANHIENVFSLIYNPHPSGTLNFPNGLTIVRSYLQCSFYFPKKESVKSFYHRVSEPGKIDLPNGNSITFEYSDHPVGNINQDTIQFCADKVSLPLIIRTRQNGDRMSLKGMTGTRKIKDIFIDEKIRLQDREIWPIVTDSTGCILWLPGLKKSAISVNEQTNSSKIIILKYIKH